MTVVVDASVILKWLFEDPTKEPDTEKALALIEAVTHGKLEILQPAHWLIEVAAVAARLTPQTAVEDVELLSAMQFPTSEARMSYFGRRRSRSRQIITYSTPCTTRSRSSMTTLYSSPQMSGIAGKQNVTG